MTPKVHETKEKIDMLDYINMEIFKNMFFIYFQREGKGWGKRERHINVWLPLIHPPTGDLAPNPGMCPDWESNQRPFGVQAGTQATGLHQPGQNLNFCALKAFIQRLKRKPTEFERISANHTSDKRLIFRHILKTPTTQL